MRFYLYIFINLFLFSATAQNLNSKITPVRTKIKTGIIEGMLDAERNLELYLGIPFAQPPVGDLRWKAPQPLITWTGIRETKSFGPAPVQPNVFGDMVSRGDGQSEDCLYLNVWTPAGDIKGLPVLVYFYGGGFVAGDASEYRYDGATMAQKGMVVVTTNYRLNIFGFLAHPELTKEAPYNASGNYGLLDQNAALQWVQENISAFGGDPERVTIAGESAGSASVSLQMASPLSKDLIAGAIGESGAAIQPTMAPVILAEGEKIGMEFLENSGYNSIADLRSLTTEEIFEIYKRGNPFRFPIVVDGYFLPKKLPEIFRAGEQAMVPLLLGWNSAEIPGTAFLQGLPYTEDNFIKKVKEVYPERFKEVLELYPHKNTREVQLSATALASDRFISYSTWKWFDLHRKNSDEPVYRYLYSRIRPPLKPMEEEENAAPPAQIGAAHAVEIEYFLGNLDLSNDFSWTAEDYQVSETIQQYLENFIKTGNPNGPQLPEWPPAAAADQFPPVMILDVKPKTAKAKEDPRYEFLNNYYGNN